MTYSLLKNDHEHKYVVSRRHYRAKQAFNYLLINNWTSEFMCIMYIITPQALMNNKRQCNLKVSNILQTQLIWAVILCNRRTTLWHLKKNVALAFKWWRILLVGPFGNWRWKAVHFSKSCYSVQQPRRLESALSIKQKLLNFKHIYLCAWPWVNDQLDAQLCYILCLLL